MRNIVLVVITVLLAAMVLQACAEPELASYTQSGTTIEVAEVSDGDGGEGETDREPVISLELDASNSEGVDTVERIETDGNTVEETDVLLPEDDTEILDAGTDPAGDSGVGNDDSTVGEQNDGEVATDGTDTAEADSDEEEPIELVCPSVEASFDPPLEVGLPMAVITVETPGGPVSRIVHFVWPGPDAGLGDQFPLVMGFHEEEKLGNNAENEVAKDWASSMKGAPIIGVFPEGRVYGTGPLYTGWDAWTTLAEKQDVFVVLGILSLMGTHPAVDSDQIFAFGRSGGAAFVGNRLAKQPCVGEIDGFGIFGFPMLDFLEGETPGFQEGMPPRSVVIAHGTNDQYISHTGGSFEPIGFMGQVIFFLSVEETFQEWSLRNGCLGNTVEASEGVNKFTGTGDGCEAKTIRFDVLGQGHDFDLQWYDSPWSVDTVNELMVLLGELGS